MPHLIRLTRAHNTHTAAGSEEITINTMRVLMMEDNSGRDDGETRIFLENGKTILVQESQDDIRDMANAT